MKKSHIALVTGLFAYSISYAQNTAWPSSTSSDNVGLGTSNPQAKLHIYNGKLVIEQTNSNGNNFASLFLQTDDSFGTRTKTGIMATGNGSWGVSDLSFVLNKNLDGTNATISDTRMIIKSSGNVGIGITSPSARLSVFHDWPLGNIAKNATLITSFAGLTGAVNANNFQDNLWLVRNQAGGDWLTARLHNGISIDGVFQQPQSDTRTWWERDPYGNIQSWGDQQNTYLTINQGNVGIGTTDPKGYKLAVAGNFISESVTVKLQSQWPDYVFKSTYKLPSLTTVKAYIDKNKHLPDMPSEAEVTKDGVNLGEMNKLLLKKVEELTLYLIDKDRQLSNEKATNQKQQQIISTLNHRLSKLESRNK